MDITNPDYLHHAQIIIEKLMEQVKDYDCVIGFQLDNETKPYDTCSKYAQAKFVEYLKNEFPDIDEFNREFGLDYWSNRVDDWDAFPDIRGTINMSLDAEYKKFQRKLVTDFFAWQADIVKKYKRDDQFITHNFDFEWHDYSYGMQPEVNQYEAAKCMDIAGCDIYHPSQSSLSGREITACGNIARGIKGDNYLVLETEAAGNHPWLPYPGQLRLQAISHIANGACMVEYWRSFCKQWLLSLGIKEDSLRLRDHEPEKLAFYSKATTDFEFLFPFGWGELWGIADRTDYDLTQHQNHSGKSLEYLDPVTNERYIPYCIEPSLGVDRMVLAFLCNAYEEQELEGGDVRTVLHLHPALAPYKAAVLPLQKNKLGALASEIHADLAKYFPVDYDETGSIGKRYRRQDEIGTPFTICVDFDTEATQSVTVRDRDTMLQERVALKDLRSYIEERMRF